MMKFGTLNYTVVVTTIDLARIYISKFKMAN